MHFYDSVKSRKCSWAINDIKVNESGFSFESIADCSKHRNVSELERTHTIRQTL